MLEFRKDVHYVSEHGNVKVDVPRVAIPRNVDERGARPERDPWRLGLEALRKLVREAKARGASLTPLGSGWSLSNAIRPMHWFVETKHLNEVMQIGVPESYLDPSYGDGKGLVFAQAGNTVARLNKVLAEAGRSLPTSGASCGQTIAGATATGTHGSAFDTSGIHGSIVALHIVGRGGKDFWVERASRPVVGGEWERRLGATIVRDDQIFDAAVVGFGSFGIIHAMLLETRPLFLLDRHRILHDFDPLVSGIRLGDDGKMVFPASALPEGRDRLYHFGFLINPSDVYERGVVVETIYDVGNAARGYPYTDKAAEHLDVGEDALMFVSDLISVFGRLANSQVRGRVEEMARTRFRLTEGHPERGVMGELFSRVELKRGGTSCEMGVNVADVARALRTVLDVVRARPTVFPGIMGVRFVRQSTATLAFTRFPVTCTIEMGHIDTSDSAALYADVWRALQAAGIAFTLHWGQVQNFEVSPVRRMYGDARVDSWRQARQRFLGEDRVLFRSKLLAQSGLE